MAKLLFGAVVLLSLLLLTPPTDAHRSGCHRWHSCPSDRGTYTCGDLGYCSQCGNNYFCRNGVYQPGWQKASTDSPATNRPKAQTVAPKVFVGVPATKADLYRCAVVGNYNSMIYHLKGSSYIRKMSPANKECFATEREAMARGFRRARAR